MRTKTKKAKIKKNEFFRCKKCESVGNWGDKKNKICAICLKKNAKK